MKKLLLFSFLTLIVLISVLLLLTATYADRVIDPFVRDLLEENKPLNHRVDYKRITVNLIKRYITVRDVRMSPDTSLEKDKNIWMEVRVSTIRLTDFHILDMLRNKTLVIGNFILIEPEVEIHFPVKVTQEALVETKSGIKAKKKSPLLNQISLEKVLLSGGTFKLIKNDITLASSEDISLVAKQIDLVRNSMEEPIGYTYGDVLINLKNLKLHSESGLYDMSLDSFIVSKEDSSIVMTGFRMIPKYDRKEFSRQLKFQDDRFDVTIGRIDIKRVGYMRFLANEPLYIGKIGLDSVNADIFRDKNVAFDFNKFPLFHNEMFLKLSLPVFIDSVRISNSLVQYSELVADRTEPGIIRLQDFNLRIDDLTNIIEDDSVVNVMKVDVKAKVMGEGPLNAELVLRLEGDTRSFECSGSVGAMNLSPLNSMLEPSINMKFNDGKLDRMTFFFEANDGISKGWMEFLYHDLDVVLLKKEPDKHWGFVSLLANSVALSNNPAPGKDLKIVEVGYERDKNKGLINYVWKTIQSGMVHTIIPIKKYEINRKPGRDSMHNEKKVRGKKSKIK